MRPFLSIALLLVSTTAFAQTDVVLAPFDTMVLESGNGRWLAELWVHNPGTQAFKVPAWWCEKPCVDVASGATVRVDAVRDETTYPGVTFTAPVHAQFSLRVRDASQGSEQIGTELPVLRNEDLFSGKATLINVPLPPRVRPTLRIYFTPAAAAGFTVRMLGERDGRLLAERVYFASPGPPLASGVASMVDASSALAGWVADAVRVVVEPHQDGIAYYPLLTITTHKNQITTVTPQ